MISLIKKTHCNFTAPTNANGHWNNCTKILTGSLLKSHFDIGVFL